MRGVFLLLDMPSSSLNGYSYCVNCTSHAFLLDVRGVFLLLGMPSSSLNGYSYCVNCTSHAFFILGMPSSQLNGYSYGVSCTTIWQHLVITRKSHNESWCWSLVVFLDHIHASPETTLHVPLFCKLNIGARA